MFLVVAIPDEPVREVAFGDLIKVPKIERPPPKEPSAAAIAAARRKNIPEKPKHLWKLQDPKVRAYIEYKCAESEKKEAKQQDKQTKVKEAVKYLNRTKPIGSPRLGKTKKTSTSRGRRGRRAKHSF